MKKLLILALILTVFGCSLNNDDTGPNIQYEVLPVESAEVPAEIQLGQATEISLTYLVPTDCHAYNDIYYAKEGNERIVAIVCDYFPDNAPCEEINEPYDISFEFLPQYTGTYVFKFWLGNDDNDQPEYLIIETEVVQ